MKRRLTALLLMLAMNASAEWHHETDASGTALERRAAMTSALEDGDDVGLALRSMDGSAGLLLSHDLNLERHDRTIESIRIAVDQTQ